MSSVEKAAAVENGEWRQRRLGPKQGSVFPKKRKLVKTMILEALFSSRPSLKSKQIAKPPCSKRVQPTVRERKISNAGVKDYGLDSEFTD
ncbi:hypothetical protein Bca101_076453 [Brassica carinata]